MTSSLHIDRAARTVRAGGVIAYPTEGVYGLGCDPYDRSAVERILAIKHRSWRKGLLLIAADLAQVERLVALPRGGMRSEILASWPGPVTWVLAARAVVPPWITGGRDSAAVRVTAHPVARRLCERLGHALVSTSANVSRRAPLVRLLHVRRQLGREVDYVLPGALGDLSGPSVIRDGRTGAVLRRGGG